MSIMFIDNFLYIPSRGWHQSWLSSGFFRDFLKIPRIGDFFESRDFYSRDSGFFLISGFLFLGFSQNRDFFGILYHRDIPEIFLSPESGFFFVGWDIPTKSQLCSKLSLPYGRVYIIRYF